MEIEKVYLTWQDIVRSVENIVAQLREEYDALLVVTRGGMIPACLISQKVDLRNILVAAVSYYTQPGQTKQDPEFLQFPETELLRDKRILVVDDVWDSGRTITAVVDRVKEAGGIPDTAILHYKPTQSKYPDRRPTYFAEEANDWLVYPWEPE